MPNGHPPSWLMVAAVAAPLLARVPLGFKVAIVVLGVARGIVIGWTAGFERKGCLVGRRGPGGSP
jgi:hypothetical protein